MGVPRLLLPAPDPGVPEAKPIADLVAKDGGPMVPGVDRPLVEGAASEPVCDGSFPTRRGRAGARIGLTSSACFHGSAGRPGGAFFAKAAPVKSSVHPSSTSSYPPLAIHSGGLCFQTVRASSGGWSRWYWIVI